MTANALSSLSSWCFASAAPLDEENSELNAMLPVASASRSCKHMLSLRSLVYTDADSGVSRASVGLLGLRRSNAQSAIPLHFLALLAARPTFAAQLARTRGECAAPQTRDSTCERQEQARTIMKLTLSTCSATTYPNAETRRLSSAALMRSAIRAFRFCSNQCVALWPSTKSASCSACFNSASRVAVRSSPARIADAIICYARRISACLSNQG